jgi:parvulin-like peptidyl-prolyl isomerase
MKKAWVLVLSLWFWLPSGFAERQLLDQVVAVVNDEIITQSEVDSLLHPLYEYYKKEYNGQELLRKLNDARRRLLNQLIEDRLVYQEAKKQGTEIDEKEVDGQMAQLQKKFSNPEVLEEALHRQGLTLTSVRERLRRQAMIRQLQDVEIRSKVVVSPMEIERYYQNHPDEFSQSEMLKVRTLTLKKNPEAQEKGLKDEKAWRHIEELREKILAGENFGEFAKQFSQDSNAQKNGLGGWIRRGEMIPEIDDVIFQMKMGEISEIIETPLGYHLFLVEERKESYKRTLEESREEIHATLFRQKSEERFNEWLSELKRAAYISIR